MLRMGLISRYGGVETFDPVTQSPAVLFDASLETYADDDLVGVATDLSGNGRDATAAGTARPTFKTGVANGRAVYRCNGTTNVLATPSFSLPSPVTYVVVVRLALAQAYPMIMTRSVYPELRCSGGSLQPSMLGPSGAEAQFGTPIGTTDFHVVVGTFDDAANEVTVAVDGAAAVTATEVAGHTDADVLTIGARAGPNFPMPGDIAWAAAFPSLDIPGLVGYLKTRYGIA